MDHKREERWVSTRLAYSEFAVGCLLQRQQIYIKDECRLCRYDVTESLCSLFKENRSAGDNDDDGSRKGNQSGRAVGFFGWNNELPSLTDQQTDDFLVPSFNDRANS